MLAKLKIHLFLLMLMLLLIAYGVLFNSSAIGWFLGGISSLAQDPIVLVFAATVGLYFNNIKHLFIAYVVSVILVNTIVSIETTKWYADLGLNSNDALSFEILFIRSTALLFLTVFFNAIRIISKKLVN